jgi:copper chaperone CopZ
MSRNSLNITLAIAAVLLLAAGGAGLVDHARRSLVNGPQSASRPAPASVPQGARLVTLEVSGMTCAKCASRVTSALSATSGVRSCDVEPASKRAWVICDRGVADSTLVAAVVRTGSVTGGGSEYTAKVIRR